MDQTIDTTQEPALDESVAAVMAELPAPVRAFLSGPERDKTVALLTSKYQLHADQAGAFSKAFFLMLLGIASPDEFVQSLREAGLNEQTVAGITVDINEQVFTKLREQEMHPGATEVPKGTPVTAARPMPAPPANLPGAGNTPDIGTPAWPQEQTIVYAAPAPRPAPVPPTVSQTPPQSQPASRPIIKEYTSDPYHEPI